MRIKNATIMTSTTGIARMICRWRRAANCCLNSTCCCSVWGTAPPSFPILKEVIALLLGVLEHGRHVEAAAVRCGDTPGGEPDVALARRVTPPRAAPDRGTCTRRA